MRWVDGQVSLEDSVDMPHPAAGRRLRESFLPGISALTLGLVHARDGALLLGPLELLRFGQPKVSGTRVEWPIEGGALARAPGGTWRLHSSGGRLVASVEGYRPSLPPAVYAVTQLPLHHLLTRLYLLRLRGRQPAAGATASSSDRLRAAAIDVAFCATLAGLIGRRRRVRTMLGIAVAYHVTCWSLSGRTLGGMVMRQRVVAVDGSRMSPSQAMLRFLALPIAWMRGRPDQDEIACTVVITVRP
ncbi:MAG: RDD family protein [Candidatus Dormibacteraceae bacterium]